MYIDRMTRKDCNVVAEIEKICFSTPWSKESFEKEFENDYAVYFTARKSCGSPIGYIGVHNICGEGEITMVAVHPDYRGCGIGEKLLKVLIDHEKNCGISRVNLEVRESNITAQKLYEKSGFSRDGLRRNYYTEPMENAILMSLDLNERN